MKEAYGQKKSWGITGEYKALTTQKNYHETRVSWNLRSAAVSHMVTLVAV